MMGPIYSHLVAMREGETVIFPDHKFRSVVKINLSQWTKTYTVSVMTWKTRDMLIYIYINTQNVLKLII